MKLDLHEIIGIPGARAPFHCSLAGERLMLPGIAEFISAPEAAGEVINRAGALELSAVISADMTCLCDRCGAAFPLRRDIPVFAPLAESLENGDDSEVFLLDGDDLNLDEVLETCFILDMDTKFLCREDCAGLCPACGKNLNDGPCSCAQTTDPRLAVLGQLLDI